MHKQTLQPPRRAGAAPGTDDPRPGDPAARPVFVDPSGRRQRRVRRLGRLLAIPAAGYVALLLSAALGGPSPDTPYLPLPAAGNHGGQTTGHPSAGTADRAPATKKQGAAPGTGSPADRPATSDAAAAGVSPPPSRPGTTPASAPAPSGASATASPTVTHGKSTATHPVPTHTGRGHQ